MEQWISHKFKNCDFSFTRSGKLDALMRGRTIPVVCKTFISIYDRIVEPGQMNLLNSVVKPAAPKTSLNGIMKRRSFLSVFMVL